jgi:hypothetical protein
LQAQPSLHRQQGLLQDVQQIARCDPRARPIEFLGSLTARERARERESRLSQRLIHSVLPPLQIVATVMSLERPSIKRLEDFLTARNARAFNHPFVGCTSLANDEVSGPAMPARRVSLMLSCICGGCVATLCRRNRLPLSQAWCTAARTQEEPKGWTEHEYSAVVGYGRNCYERTRTNVLAWRVMDAVTLLVPMEDMQ